MIQRFKTRPVKEEIIEAVMFDGTNREEIVKFVYPDGEPENSLIGEIGRKPNRFGGDVYIMFGYHSKYEFLLQGEYLYRKMPGQVEQTPVSREYLDSKYEPIP